MSNDLKIVSPVYVVPNHYLRVTPDGRAFFDSCNTDAEHMAAPTPEGQERRMCRVYLEDMLPLDDTAGKKGVWKISIEFVEDGTPEDLQ